MTTLAPRRARRIAAALLLIVAYPAGAATAAADGSDPAASRSADGLLAQVGFTADDRARVLAGDTVERGLAAAGHHDLGVALALLMRVPAERVSRAFVEEALIIAQDPGALAHGTLPDDATLTDFASVELADAERAVYRSARAGEKLNLSHDELAAVKRAGPEPTAIDAVVRELLLARLRAYRAKGLDGVAPYARAHGHTTDAAAMLRQATRAAPAVGDLDPALARFLDQYPNAKLPDYREAWHWVRYRAHGDPNLVLAHTFSTAIGGVTVVAQRQFYVSRGYDVEQAIVAFAPVTEGVVAIYWNHTSTDQIGGMAAGVERAVGERLMGHQLEGLLERIRAALPPD